MKNRSWIDIENFIVHRELQIVQERSAMEELKKYYTEKDNQFFLGYIDFIEKNKR